MKAVSGCCFIEQLFGTGVFYWIEKLGCFSTSHFAEIFLKIKWLLNGTISRIFSDSCGEGWIFFDLPLNKVTSTTSKVELPRGDELLSPTTSTSETPVFENKNEFQYLLREILTIKQQNKQILRLRQDIQLQNFLKTFLLPCR